MYYCRYDVELLFTKLTRHRSRIHVLAVFHRNHELQLYIK